MMDDVSSSKRTREEEAAVLTQPIVPHPEPTSKYRYAMVCSSNINRSVEAHTVLQNAGFQVESYGCGKHLRLPGPKEARVFEFGTPYETIATCLQDEAPAHYIRTGVLDLARRAALTKLAPQRWQDAAPESISHLNVVIVFENRLFDVVVAGECEGGSLH